VTTVCSAWVIILQDTARLQVPPSLTKSDDEPTSLTSVRTEADRVGAAGLQRQAP
jgi:hypothetical protein